MCWLCTAFQLLQLRPIIKIFVALGQSESYYKCMHMYVRRLCTECWRSVFVNVWHFFPLVCQDRTCVIEPLLCACVSLAHVRKEGRGCRGLQDKTTLWYGRLNSQISELTVVYNWEKMQNLTVEKLQLCAFDDWNDYQRSCWLISCWSTHDESYHFNSKHNRPFVLRFICKVLFFAVSDKHCFVVCGVVVLNCIIHWAARKY